MEEKHQADRGQHPAEPLKDALFRDDEHHQNGNQHHRQGDGQELPQQKIHLAAPGGQGGFQGADDVGVDHINQGRKLLAIQGKHIGNAGKDGGNQIATQFFQGESSSVADLSTGTEFPGNRQINQFYPYGIVYHISGGLSAIIFLNFHCDFQASG